MNKITSIQHSIPVIGGLIVLIWWLKLGEVALGWGLHQLGVYPQNLPVGATDK